MPLYRSGKKGGTLFSHSLAALRLVAQRSAASVGSAAVAAGGLPCAFSYSLYFSGVRRGSGLSVSSWGEVQKSQKSQKSHCKQQ